MWECLFGDSDCSSIISLDSSSELIPPNLVFPWDLERFFLVLVLLSFFIILFFALVCEFSYSFSSASLSFFTFFTCDYWEIVETVSFTYEVVFTLWSGLKAICTEFKLFPSLISRILNWESPIFRVSPDSKGYPLISSLLFGFLTLKSFRTI